MRRLLLLFPLLLTACGGTGNPAVPQLRPVEGGWVSSAFGLREDHPVLGVTPGRMHDGYDFAVAAGSPIRATMAGDVVYAGWKGGYGKTIEIVHEGGWTTLYGHAGELLAGPGDHVTAGATIATVGSTGLSTGPHLHYELRKGGKAVDPGRFLPDAVPKAAVAGKPVAVTPVAVKPMLAQPIASVASGLPPAPLARPALTHE